MQIKNPLFIYMTLLIGWVSIDLWKHTLYSGLSSLGFLQTDASYIKMALLITLLFFGLIYISSDTPIDVIHVLPQKTRKRVHERGVWTW